MKIYTENIEVVLRELGVIPGVDVLAKELITSFDLVNDDTKLNENVFMGTHRLVATNPYSKGPQKYSSGNRTDKLLDLVQPQINFLQIVYPDHIPVLVQCATLPKNTELKWHYDTYLYQNTSHKIHIPIYTNEKALFQIQDRTNNKHSIHFEVGQAYEINNIMLHRSLNQGQTYRAHVIIDMMHRSQLAEYQEQNIDFFFTHHTENKALEKLL